MSVLSQIPIPQRFSFLLSNVVLHQRYPIPSSFPFFFLNVYLNQYQKAPASTPSVFWSGLGMERNLSAPQWQFSERALILTVVFLATSLFLDLIAPTVSSPVFTLKRFHSSRFKGALTSEEFEVMKSRDRVRHSRILQSVLYFPLQGSTGEGLYFTEIQLGTPPKTFFVQIDTGSDLMWVNCKTCNSCPMTSDLGIDLNFFDTEGSSTVQPIFCTDPSCMDNKLPEVNCNSQGLCGYRVHYADLSATQGFYLSDLLTYSQLLQNDLVSNSSARITFGCSFKQDGQLREANKAVDGIFGFGRSRFSVISQLHSQGIAPKIFSHCLIGEHPGGGVFVFGKIMAPGMLYTPIVQSQPHYNVNLLSIAVNGRQLPIDPQVFATSNGHGTIIDCGTSLSYFTEEAYNIIINSIITAVSQYAQPYQLEGSICFSTNYSIDEVFPPVTLYFEGATMELSPRDYLMQRILPDVSPMWCIGWQKSGQGPNDNVKMTILGDLVLKDKIVVYDLENQQIGWTKYDCASSITVSPVSDKELSDDSSILERSGGSSSARLRKVATHLGYLIAFCMAIFSKS